MLSSRLHPEVDYWSILFLLNRWNFTNHYYGVHFEMNDMYFLSIYGYVQCCGTAMNKWREKNAACNKKLLCPEDFPFTLLPLTTVRADTGDSFHKCSINAIYKMLKMFEVDENDCFDAVYKCFSWEITMREWTSGGLFACVCVYVCESGVDFLN